MGVEVRPYILITSHCCFIFIINRLYYDIPEKHPLMASLCDLSCTNPNIDLCYVKEIPASGDISKVFAMNWRFMPLLDPQVSHFVSRDLDSRLNAREGAAVQEWLLSDKAFHFMRDHPAHRYVRLV